MSRLIALVSREEAASIAAKAAAAGLSVSAFLPERALGEEHAERFDQVLDRIESDLAAAVTTVDAALARMDAHG
jgi:putative heme iron utilization protein